MTICISLDNERWKLGPCFISFVYPWLQRQWLELSTKGNGKYSTFISMCQKRSEVQYKWFYMILGNKTNTYLEFDGTILLYLILIYWRIWLPYNNAMLQSSTIHCIITSTLWSNPEVISIPLLLPLPPSSDFP